MSRRFDVKVISGDPSIANVVLVIAEAPVLSLSPIRGLRMADVRRPKTRAITGLATRSNGASLG
jgi:hypothetical protein